MVETRSQRSRSQRSRAEETSAAERLELLNNVLESASTPWPVQHWIEGHEHIEGDQEAMHAFRNLSIQIASLCCDITSQRIASAGHLGDWIYAAKETIVRAATSNLPLLMMY